MHILFHCPSLSSERYTLTVTKSEDVRTFRKSVAEKLKVNPANVRLFALGKMVIINLLTASFFFFLFFRVAFYICNKLNSFIIISGLAFGSMRRWKTSQIIFNLWYQRECTCVGSSC